LGRGSGDARAGEEKEARCAPVCCVRAGVWLFTAAPSVYGDPVRGLVVSLFCEGPRARGRHCTQREKKQRSDYCSCALALLYHSSIFGATHNPKWTPRPPSRPARPPSRRSPWNTLSGRAPSSTRSRSRTAPKPPAASRRSPPAQARPARPARPWRASPPHPACWRPRTGPFMWGRPRWCPWPARPGRPAPLRPPPPARAWPCGFRRPPGRRASARLRPSAWSRVRPPLSGPAAAPPMLWRAAAAQWRVAICWGSRRPAPLRRRARSSPAMVP